MLYFSSTSCRNPRLSMYPPQQKSFQMLAYFNDHLRDQYDWFIRLDDDSVLQWENLNELLVKLDPDNKTLIGSPGYGRDQDDFIEKNMVYCMGGTGIIYSNALVRAIRHGYQRTFISSHSWRHKLL